MYKPQLTSGYNNQQLNLVHSMCLYLCTILGDYVDDFVIVGGLVPNLIIPQNPLPEGIEAHVGTLDLDIGLSIGVFDSSRYQEIVERLRGAGFIPDVNKNQNPTFQRWRLNNSIDVTVDFLIPQITKDEIGGSLKHLDTNFGAVITPGLELAFQDRTKITISGKTPFGEKAKRDVWVCGPGAYIILKALAFESRGENKDAYDLFYVIRNFGNGHQEVIQHILPLINSKHGKQAIKILDRDFSNPELIGPVRVARFLYGSVDERTQVEVSGYVNQLLTGVK
jgi:hypothetical protein